jgi:hypothetical protein
MYVKQYKIVVLLLLMFAFSMPTAVHGIEAEEYRLKAVFVLNFARYTEWPAEMKVDSGAFTISIIGPRPSATFTNALNGQTIRGARVTVKFVDNVLQAKNSQLLYVSGVELSNLIKALRDVSHYPVLTVSDIPGFCEAGGMIGMVRVENRLGFDINYPSIRKAGLSVSTQLLKLAKVIYDK